MKQTLTFCLVAVLVFVVSALAQRAKSAGNVVDLKSIDGTILKATYFTAAKPGPGVLLFHQSNEHVSPGTMSLNNWRRRESTHLLLICADIAKENSGGRTISTPHFNF
jgi:hypothetical protein